MKVLIALDTSEYSEIVLEHGLDHAARIAAAELHFVTAIADDADPARARRGLEAQTRDALEAFGFANSPVTYHVRRGRPAAVVATLAVELPADLLVIGRFHVPSAADALLQIVECPLLVVGIDGPVLEPQCPACRAVRRQTDGEELFCAAHHSNKLPDLATRLPPTHFVGGTIW